MNMKKIMALLLSVCLAFSLAACSFGPRMAKAATAMEKISSFHMDLNLDLGITMSMLGQESGLELTMKESMDVQKDPLTAAAKIETTILEQTESVLAYLMPAENGGHDLYLSHNDGNNWERQHLEDAELPEYSGLCGSLDQLTLLAKVASGFSEAGTETVNGAPAIRYDGEIKGAYVSQALENSGLIASLEETFDLDMSELNLEIEGSIPASIWLDKSSGRIVRYDMDMAEAISSVWDVIMEQLMQSEEFSALSSMGLSLSITQAKLSAVLSNFDELGEILLPESAKAA